MKKCGFTLAEVLITLGIVGVIAALTAPGLVMNSRNEANAAKLAVVVSNLENALTTAIAQEGVSSLFETKMWPTEGLANDESKDADVARFVGRLGQYLHVNGYILTRAATLYYNVSAKEPYGLNANGGVNTNARTVSTMDRTFIVELKNGAAIFMRLAAPSVVDNAVKDTIINNGGSLTQLAAAVFIDVNGKSGPNAHGRDIFHYYVGSDGILYPYGGMDVSVYESQGHGRTDVWSNSSSDQSCVDGNIKNGIGCTARLISEGYKMNY